MATEVQERCANPSRNKSELAVCDLKGLDLKLIDSKIKALTGVQHKDIRILYWKDLNEIYLAASAQILEKNFCYINYDKVFKYNSITQVIKLQWDSEKHIAEIIDNVGQVMVLKHTDLRSRDYGEHNCESLFYIRAANLVGSNIGAKYSKLLAQNNFLVFTKYTSTFYFFSPDFKNLIGSYSFYDMDKNYLDVAVANNGNLYTVSRNFPTNQFCVEEHDFESSRLLAQNCTHARRISYTIFKFLEDTYVFDQTLLRHMKLYPISDFFTDRYKNSAIEVDYNSILAFSALKKFKRNR